ncbi:MAG: putative two-component response regulator [Holophagaceae bacterium]|nr:putative two-component response regulator [Holophagaceae bacterium]
MNLKSIVLVEDNPQDEMLTLRSLEKAKLANEIVVLRDGQEALDYLLEPDRDLPTVVLLDLGLPKVSGLEVLTRLRKDPRTRLLPVTILTSSDEEEDRLRCYEGGANSFVRKPVEFAAFAETIARVGFYWAILNEAVQPRRSNP